jgi:hypothetical protein
MAKKYRNKNGDSCYVFSWEQGGGNHVFAHSKKGAVRRAKFLGMGTHNRDGDKLSKPVEGRIVLTPDEKTIRSVTFDQFKEFDRGLYLMTI